MNARLLQPTQLVDRKSLPSDCRRNTNDIVPNTMPWVDGTSNNYFNQPVLIMW